MALSGGTGKAIPAIPEGVIAGARDSWIGFEAIKAIQEIAGK